MSNHPGEEMAPRGGRFHGSSVWSGEIGVGFSCCLESPWDFMGKNKMV